MKKNIRTKAIALACAGALALSMAPAAFAADTGTVTDDGTNLFKDGTAESKLAIKTNATNIKASVPLKVEVYADPAGGAFAAVPSSGDYVVKNKSYFPIYVTGVKAAAGSDWTYSDTALAANAQTSAKVGDVNVTLKAAADASAVPVTAAGIAPNWEIAAATSDSVFGELPLDFNGSTSVLKKQIGDTASEAVTLTYTISATK